METYGTQFNIQYALYTCLKTKPRSRVQSRVSNRCINSRVENFTKTNALYSTTTFIIQLKISSTTAIFAFVLSFKPLLCKRHWASKKGFLIMPLLKGFYYTSLFRVPKPALISNSFEVVKHEKHSYNSLVNGNFLYPMWFCLFVFAFSFYWVP